MLQLLNGFRQCQRLVQLYHIPPPLCSFFYYVKYEAISYNIKSHFIQGKHTDEFGETMSYWTSKYSVQTHRTITQLLFLCFTKCFSIFQLIVFGLTDRIKSATS